MKLEICTGDILGVRAALRGGADRVELCSGLSEGGLTPSIALISKASALMPVNVLIRPRAGDFVYSEEEIDLMAHDIRVIRDCGAQGIVVGALTPEGKVDVRACERLLSAAGNIDTTFHRAFDVARHPFETLEDIISLGFKRLLTSGQASTAIEGADLIRRLHERAAGRISIMAGSGVNPDNIKRLMEESFADEFHASARSWVASGMKVESSAVMGMADASDGSRLATDESIVRRLSHSIRGFFVIIATLCVLASAARTPVRDASHASVDLSAVSSDYARRLDCQGKIADRLRLPSGLTAEESDAMEFLYAYMPTPDILDHSADFHLRNVRCALRARSEMSWGESVPDREWRHFVLPVRVNNEALDNSRELFYEELKERVKGLTMKEAILEVNHWCHEKVSYSPSDMRTSAPLATLRNASGRCGEESTFTVAALRSIGIPARQVYTPRWAHTDDNHAWVEAWADGKWWFFGACEPEPELNMGWFNEPASRGMLMSTDVAGADYDGPEDIIGRSPVSVSINVTRNYAPVKETRVFVYDADSNPVRNAEVRFCLYNYAEFYPLAKLPVDTDGTARFLSGCGDLLVWASDGKRFGFSGVHAGDTLHLRLDKEKGYEGVHDFDIVPPKGMIQKRVIPETARLLNESRKLKEDSIRNSYIATFLTPSSAAAKLRELGLPALADDASAVEVLVEARGNAGMLLNYLHETPVEERERVIRILKTLSEKDLHDVTSEVLTDNLLFSTPEKLNVIGADSLRYAIPQNILKKYYDDYVLKPGVEYELLTPYKEFFQKTLSAEKIAGYLQNPRRLAQEIKSMEKATLDGHGEFPLLCNTDYNPAGLRQSPRSTYESGIGTLLDRKILFVAICRSIGIPAALDDVTGEARYVDVNGEWENVDLSPDMGMTAGDTLRNVECGSDEVISLRSNPEGKVIPKYYSHFTLSKISGGFPELIEFGDFESIEQVNARHKELPPGQYMLTSGQRMASGDVLARIDIFSHPSADGNSPMLTLRADDSRPGVIGNFDAESLYKPLRLEKSPDGKGLICFSEDDKRSILSAVGRGYYVLGFISPGHEPSRHAINDIAEASSEIEQTGRKILILLRNKEDADKFFNDKIPELPSNVIFGLDSDMLLSKVAEGLELTGETSGAMPHFIVADSFNRIVFHQAGYTIRIGDRLHKVLQQCE